MANSTRSSIKSFFRQDPNLIVLVPIAGSSLLVDLSGGGRNATAVNSPASGPSSLVRRQTYKFVNQKNVAPKHLTVAASATVTWAAGALLSMIFWALMDTTVAGSGETNYRFIEKAASSGGGSSGNFNINTGNYLIGFSYTNATGSATYSIAQSSGLGFRVGVWVMFAITYTFPTSSNATKPRLYVNGADQPMGSWSSTPNGTVITSATDPLRIACDAYSVDHSNDNRGFNGRFGEVGFWKGRILSPVEIAAYYRSAIKFYRSESMGLYVPAGGGSSMPVFHSSYQRRRAA